MPHTWNQYGSIGFGLSLAGPAHQGCGRFSEERDGGNSRTITAVAEVRKGKALIGTPLNSTECSAFMKSQQDSNSGRLKAVSKAFVQLLVVVGGVYNGGHVLRVHISRGRLYLHYVMLPLLYLQGSGNPFFDVAFRNLLFYWEARKASSAFTRTVLHYTHVCM